MITITSISLVTHSALKEELTTAVCKGAEQTMNMIFIYQVYPSGTSDEIIYDVLQNIILSKASDNELVVNIYNKDGIDDRELDIEAIQTYTGLLGKKREVRYRVKMVVEESSSEDKKILSYIKYDKPDENAEISQTWKFSAASVSNIKSFLNSDDGKTPSLERNQRFFQRYGYCKTNG
jgi:hypothetical protein